MECFTFQCETKIQRIFNGTRRFNVSQISVWNLASWCLIVNMTVSVDFRALFFQSYTFYIRLNLIAFDLMGISKEINHFVAIWSKCMYGVAYIVETNVLQAWREYRTKNHLEMETKFQKLFTEWRTFNVQPQENIGNKTINYIGKLADILTVIESFPLIIIIIIIILWMEIYLLVGEPISYVLRLVW